MAEHKFTDLSPDERRRYVNAPFHLPCTIHSPKSWSGWTVREHADDDDRVLADALAHGFHLDPTDES